MCKWHNNNGEDGILPPRIWHRLRSIVCRHAIISVSAKWVGVLCLTTDKRGPKLDMLNYSSTYIPWVSFVAETPFASDKSPLKLVGQREALPTGRLSQALDAAKTTLTTNSSNLRHLNTWLSPNDQNATADRS